MIKFNATGLQIFLLFQSISKSKHSFNGSFVMDSNSTIRLIKLEFDQIIQNSRVVFSIGFQLGLIFRGLNDIL